MQQPIKAPVKEPMSLFLQNRYLIIGILALACFSASLLIHVGAVSHVLTEIAYALVIAVAISFGIEAASRRELETAVRSQLEQHAGKLLEINNQLTNTVDAIGHGVYVAVFKRRVPDVFLDEIEQGILRTDFARADNNATYHLKVVSAEELKSKTLPAQMMAVNVRSKYEVKNITHAKKDYEFSIFIDNAGLEELANYTQINYVKANGKEISLDEAEIFQTDKYTKYTFRAPGVPAGNKIEVENDISYIRHLDDYEIWTTAIASDGMALTINVPDTVKQWDVFSIHRQPLRTLNKYPTFGSFELASAVLPYQGMVIWWRSSTPNAVIRGSTESAAIPSSTNTSSTG